jgi:hypothetical protein
MKFAIRKRVVGRIKSGFSVKFTLHKRGHIECGFSLKESNWSALDGINERGAWTPISSWTQEKQKKRKTQRCKQISAQPPEIVIKIPPIHGSARMTVQNWTDA